MERDCLVATEDDSLEWLFKTEGEGDNGYYEFFSTVDTILMGRRTYDWLIEKEKGWLTATLIMIKKPWSKLMKSG